MSAGVLAAVAGVCLGVGAGAVPAAALPAAGPAVAASSKALHAKGAAPILVIGTTGDPATPYEWAEALADQLDSGQLLTWEGNGHAAYTNSGHGPCVTQAVDTYLLTGTMPKKGLTCHGKQ